MQVLHDRNTTLHEIREHADGPAVFHECSGHGHWGGRAFWPWACLDAKAHESAILLKGHDIPALVLVGLLRVVTFRKGRGTATAKKILQVFQVRFFLVQICPFFLLFQYVNEKQDTDKSKEIH